MSKRHLLYGIMAIAIVGILAVVIGYTTDSRPAQTIEQSGAVNTSIPAAAKTSTATDTSTVKEKSCGCCAERKARLEKKIQAARARKLARQQAQTVVTSQ